MSVARRVVLVAVGAMAIVIGLGLIALLRSEGVPGPEPSTPSEFVEETLLLQVLDGEGYALGNVVLGIEPPDARPETVFLALPSSLLVPAGDDSITLGNTPSSADTLAAVNAVQDGVDIRIDAGIILERLAFAGLVDAVDGLWVDLDRPVLLPTVGDGQWRTLGPGLVKMDGIAAADYAVMRLPGETEQARIDRFLGILEETLARLPRTSEQMRQLLTSLGSLAQTTVPTEDLVPFFMQVRADVVSERTQSQTLPVTVIRGGLRPASVAGPEAPTLVQSLFADARMTTGSGG